MTHVKDLSKQIGISQQGKYKFLCQGGKHILQVELADPQRLRPGDRPAPPGGAAFSIQVANIAPGLLEL